MSQDSDSKIYVSVIHNLCGKKFVWEVPVPEGSYLPENPINDNMIVFICSDNEAIIKGFEPNQEYKCPRCNKNVYNNDHIIKDVITKDEARAILRHYTD